MPGNFLMTFLSEFGIHATHLWLLPSLLSIVAASWLAWKNTCIAATLNDLGILDRAHNQPAEARKAFEEALNIYKSLARQDPDQFSPLVERVKKLLKNFPK
jgi:hypothetical protein